MPTYEYECRECGHQLEEFQGINAAPLKKCPACGAGLEPESRFCGNCGTKL